MTDAPERIWIDAWGGNWSPVSGGTQEIEYVRADRIEALTEQLEAARADAKEAEAYAEELQGDLTELCRQLIAEEARLAKAVEALQAFKAFDDMPTKYKRPDVFEVSVRRKLLSTLAEIEGEK